MERISGKRDDLAWSAPTGRWTKPSAATSSLNPPLCLGHVGSRPMHCLVAISQALAALMCTLVGLVEHRGPGRFAQLRVVGPPPQQDVGVEQQAPQRLTAASGNLV